MTKFSTAENADFQKIVRILTSMMKNTDAKIESNWSIEVLRKRGESTSTYNVESRTTMICLIGGF